MTDHRADIEALTANGEQTLFWASNFSIGVAIFSAVNRYLAKIMNGFPQYDVEMKRRTTSTSSMPRRARPHPGRGDCRQPRPQRHLEGRPHHLGRRPYRRLGRPQGHRTAGQQRAPRRGAGHPHHQLRLGADKITITHDAHSRKGFALGAVLAAEYTKDHTGLLTTSDLFAF
jgi:4-hydroxy-tetrahydrodipicolinate reductase